MCWLLDDSAFESANDSTSVLIRKLRKCLSLAECIVYVSKNKFTSFHLGLALQFCFPQMQHTEELWLYMRTVSGGKDGRRYITVHDLCSPISNITCKILPSLHALIGCDTTSVFFRIGKNYVYKILKTSPEELSDLVALTNTDLETTINAARHALSLIYDPKEKFKSCHHDLNILRIKLATSKDASLSRIICYEQSISFTELCPCQGSDLCQNSLTHQQKTNVDEQDKLEYDES